MNVPVLNNDIIRVTRNWKTKKYVIDKKDAAHLLRIIADLQVQIDAEMGPKPNGPLRFVIPLAMRFTEQAGRADFRHPKGNNPYNVMGEGVERPHNKEVVNGERVRRKAVFQGYGSEAEGVAAFFKALRTMRGGIWSGAWEAIRDVSSFEAYARGLRPEGTFHYLTELEEVHVRGLKGRAREALKLLDMIYPSEINRIKAESADDEVLIAALASDPTFGPGIKQRLAVSHLGIENARAVSERIAVTRTKLDIN